LAAFAMLVVHSLLRYAARLPSTQNPFRRKSGNRILAAEMKENDA
jgi:hypothetical protein